MSAAKEESHNDEVLQFESFQDPNFLRQTLNPTLALEYFYTSKFFDVTSLNQRRRRGLPVPPDADGIEYSVVRVNAAGKNILPVPFNSPWNYPNNFGVFIIQKTRRTNKNEAPERIFYIAGSCIYQAPSLAGLVLHRLQSACRHLDSVLEKLEEMLHWSVLSGHHWKAPLDLKQIIEDIQSKKPQGTDDRMGDDTSASSSSIDSDASVDASSDDDESLTTDSDATERVVELFRLDPLDDFSVPLSMKVIRPPKSTNITVVYQPREIEHAQEVIGKEFSNLFKASTRLSSMFVSELEQRGKTEGARREVFAEYHNAIDSIQASLLNNMQRPLSNLIPDVDISTELWNLETAASPNESV
eukprot:Gregarina_sp_Poly_1__3853@NODE_214_length_11311_cov_270_018855_g190_i0_p4_GENE_NODE_214_length_11311_cov_270_018855_g190_i0NODE_214_length_11311_cov_270_018855_g190_i0_p4_ORF_typecomplete_len357_score44_90Med6/PF04934_14/4_3e24TMEM131_like/PF12371_8/0_27_NODE_214_length_11311_cov_270_018855_g190_i051966266